MSLGLTLTRMPTATQPGLMVRVFTRVCDFFCLLLKLCRFLMSPFRVFVLLWDIHTFDA